MQAKLFAGVRLSFEMKEPLKKSGLTLISYEGKEYAGLYAKSAPTLVQLRELSAHIASILHSHLPEHSGQLEIVVFPQLFLG